MKISKQCWLQTGKSIIGGRILQKRNAVSENKQRQQAISYLKTMKFINVNWPYFPPRVKQNLVYLRIKKNFETTPRHKQSCFHHSANLNDLESLAELNFCMVHIPNHTLQHVGILCLTLLFLTSRLCLPRQSAEFLIYITVSCRFSTPSHGHLSVYDKVPTGWEVLWFLLFYDLSDTVKRGH